jgi:hypothetical protein
MLRGAWESWFGRSAWRQERPARGAHVPSWLALVGVLAAFAGGFLIGGKVGTPASASEIADLQARAGTKPQVLDADTKPLSRRAFIVAAYTEIEEAAALIRARALAGWLVTKGIDTARPFHFRPVGSPTSEPVWITAVYFQDDADRARIAELLLKLPQDVPDDVFCQLRNSPTGWPKSYPIQ